VEIPQFLFNADLTLKFKSFVSVLNANYIGFGAVNDSLNEKVESVKRYNCMAANLHVNETALSNISNCSKSFFLFPTSLYLLTVGVEGYGCTWPHSIICKHTDNDTHIHTHKHTRTQWRIHIYAQTFTTGRATLVERSELTGTSNRQHTTFTRDRHPCHWRDSNAQSQKAICRRITPYIARPPASDNCSKIKMLNKNLYLTALNIFRSIDTAHTQCAID